MLAHRLIIRDEGFSNLYTSIQTQSEKGSRFCYYPKAMNQTALKTEVAFLITLIKSYRKKQSCKEMR